MAIMEVNQVNCNRSFPPTLLPPVSKLRFNSRHPFPQKPFKFRPCAVKCIHSKPSNNVKPSTSSSNTDSQHISYNRILDAILRGIDLFKKPTVVAILVSALLMYDPAALAASGGRMGGRSFSSSSSSSSSRSYSTSSRSRSLSSVLYHSRRSSSYSPSPFGGGEYVWFEPEVDFGVGGYLMFMGFAAFVLVSRFRLDKGEGSVVTDVDKTSVIKLQVGLLGMKSSLQKDLNRIARVADTSTREGLSYVLTETALALLGHPDYCVSGYSSVDVKSMDEGEKRFNQLSTEERGKFDEETLVNVNNIRRQSSYGQKSSGFSNEYIVVTILVAAQGVRTLPCISRSIELKEALRKLAAIPATKIQAVEVLWTPQNENDMLSERELLEDYPLLRPLIAGM